MQRGLLRANSHRLNCGSTVFRIQHCIQTLHRRWAQPTGVAATHLTLHQPLGRRMDGAESSETGRESGMWKMLSQMAPDPSSTPKPEMLSKVRPRFSSRFSLASAPTRPRVCHWQMPVKAVGCLEPPSSTQKTGVGWGQVNERLAQENRLLRTGMARLEQLMQVGCPRPRCTVLVRSRG